MRSGQSPSYISLGLSIQLEIEKANRESLSYLPGEGATRSLAK